MTNNLVNFRDRPVAMIFNFVQFKSRRLLGDAYRAYNKYPDFKKLSLREFSKYAVFVPAANTSSMEIAHFVHYYTQLEEDPNFEIDIMSKDFPDANRLITMYHNLVYGNLNLAFVHIDANPGVEEPNFERNLNLTINDLRFDYLNSTLKVEFGYIPFGNNTYNMGKMIRIFKQLIKDTSDYVKELLGPKEYFKLMRKYYSSRYAEGFTGIVKRANDDIEFIDVTIRDSKNQVHDLVFKTNFALESKRISEGFAGESQSIFKVVNEVSILKNELDYLLDDYNQFEVSKIKEGKEIYLKQSDDILNNFLSEEEAIEFSQMFKQKFEDPEEEDDEDGV